MSEPPENEPDAASAPGTEPEPDARAEAAPDEDAKPSTADAAPSDHAKTAEDAPSDDAQPPVTEAAAPPKKKASKKKKKKSVKAAPPKDEAKDDTAEPKEKEEKEAPKPIPGAGTPDGEKLARAVQAFDAGNYAVVRRLTTELEQATDADVKEYAKGLRRRIDVDPIQIVVLVACLALFLVIAYVYVLE